MTAVLLALALVLPNAALTPGATRKLSQRTVCATKWGKDRRHVTEAMKREVAARYHVPRASIVGRGRGPCCEYDHLVSRELGGADVVANLWPQPWVEAVQKDALENWLHREVCAGRMRLAAAQHAIATDWPGALARKTSSRVLRRR